MTSAAANMATGITDSAGSETCGEKMGGEESRKISDNRADCPDAEYDDKADRTEPSNNLWNNNRSEARRPPHPRQHRRESPRNRQSE